MSDLLTARVAGVVVLAAVLLAAAGDAAALSPAAARGKQIYVNGSSEARRDITALVGMGSTALPASALPCTSCHGPDGLGRPEGGVTPANITWTQLAKPYRALSGVVRTRPAYTEASVARAIATGIDAGGVQLDASMPRYRMHPEDMTDLVAYLQYLEDELDPGLSETAITLGTLLPSGSRTAALGDAVRGVLEAYFAELNAAGGVYNRKLELRVASAADADAVLELGRAMIEGGEVFAMVAAFTAGLERELDAAVEAHGMPLVGPFTQFTGEPETLRRFTFHLYGGLDVQARALAEYASTGLVPDGAKLGVVHVGTRDMREVAVALRSLAERRGWPAPVLIEYPGPEFHSVDSIAAKLSAEQVDALLFLGPGADFRAVAVQSAQNGWTPFLLSPGALAGGALLELPAAYTGRIFLSFPTGPSDYTDSGAEAFNAFRERHSLPREHTPTQIATYAAVGLLVDGLKAAGRSLSREKLIAWLEGRYQYETGLTPNITYGRNRRIGALGAHVVAVDLERKLVGSTSRWVATP
jgi:ABC-type branched-subunit amino acid transport system substrate-binding protein